MLRLYLLAALLTNAQIASTRASLPPTVSADDESLRHPADCLTNSLEDSFYCRGSRAIRNVIHNLSKHDKPLVIVRGLEIVPTPQQLNASAAASSPEDDSFLGHFATYLRTHELNIKFSDLLNERRLERDSEQGGVKIGVDAASAGEARKKDKGQGLLLAMAVMFAKMMAVMGLGGIGALAMKALGVAMAALMMAGIIGLKSLSQHGNESSHSVQYVSAEGHHKRRRRNVVDTLEMPLAYRGWHAGVVKQL